MHILKTFISGALLLTSLLWLSIQRVLLPQDLSDSYETLQRLETKLDMTQFKKDWCRVRNQRLVWRQIVKSCHQNIDFIKDNRASSSPYLSQVSNIINKPAGEYTKILIDTYTNNGLLKTFGGDSFRVLLRGPDILSATVIDLRNGTYEALVLPMTPGLYKLQVILDYTLCNGFKDPPSEWYVKAHCSGKKNDTIVPSNVLSQTADYINTEVSPGIMLHITKPRFDISSLAEISSKIDCGFSCNQLWDGYGAWSKEGKWKDYIRYDINKKDNQLTTRENPQKDKTLWVYGDSISYYFLQRLKRTNLCKDKFTFCENTYNWIYPKQLYELRHFCEDINLNVTKLVSTFSNVLSHKLMDEESVLIFNLGAHFVKNVSFHKYKQIIDEFIKALKKYKGRIIWKTTTAIHGQNVKVMGAFRRFLTSQRVLLFNAYANSAICNAGMELLDVYPITASFPRGTKDGVHYHQNVSLPIENYLNEYF